MIAVLRKFLWVGLTAFGAARWTSLEAAFVRPGLIREEDFFRDFAVAQTLPGPGFVNLAALCGMRLGGVVTAVLAVALVLLPGLVAIVLALAFLSTDAPWVAGFYRGILVGAVGLLVSSYVRSAQRVNGWFDASLAAAATLLLVTGVPLFNTILVVGVVGTLRNRFTPQTLP